MPNYESRIKTAYSELKEGDNNIFQWGKGEYKGKLIDLYSDDEFIRDGFTEPIIRHWQKEGRGKGDKLILDMGGGDGILLATILRQLAVAGFDKVRGIDLDLDPSGRNFKIFNQKKEKGEYPDNLMAVKGDIFAPPFRDGSADVVVSRRVIQYFSQEQQIEFLKKMRGVLKNSGLAIIEWPAGGQGFNELFTEITQVIMRGEDWQRDFPRFSDFYPDKLPALAGFEPVLGRIRAREFATPQSFAHRFNLDHNQIRSIEQDF